MGGRGSAGRSSARPVDSRVRRAYADLAERAGDLVSLARLRDTMPDVDRVELDATLLAMDRRGEIQLEPDPHRIALTQRARDAAIWLGGEDMHLFTVIPPRQESP